MGSIRLQEAVKALRDGHGRNSHRFQFHWHHDLEHTHTSGGGHTSTAAHDTPTQREMRSLGVHARISNRNLTRYFPPSTSSGRRARGWDWNEDDIPAGSIDTHAGRRHK